MVRKVAKLGDKGLQLDLPYPTTPISPNNPSLTRDQAHRDGQIPVVSQSSPNQDLANGSDSTNAWATLPRPNVNSNGLPRILKIAEGRDETNINMGNGQGEQGLPPSLKAGNVTLTPRSSSESQRSTGIAEEITSIMKPDGHFHSSVSQNQNSNNPFLRMKNVDGILPKEVNSAGENSMDVWASTQKPPLSRDLGHSKPSSSNTIENSQAFSQPWVDFSSSSVDQASLEPNASIRSPNIDGPIPENPYQELSGNPFHNYVPNNQDNNQDALLPNPSYGVPNTTNSYASELQELEGRWPGSIADFPVHHSKELERDLPSDDSQTDDIGPELPPRRTQEEEDSPPPQPLRPNLENLGKANDISQIQSNAITQQTQAASQRNKTYQIKLVNWFDASSPINPRKSPIMVQNANGPCPLLALVNALTLSTPSNIDTTLVETLQVREQISLGFLLDAVIDELMSGRRGDAAQNLPDVSDLYAFLVNLHTGMNVNPSFVQLESNVTSLLDAPIVESPAYSNLLRTPGSFEDTKEMRLYSTFAVPLIHGWIPAKNHPAFAALKRSARNYEEAQNLMFREEELEDKLQRQGLTQSEQLMLEDISSVKYFLSSSATQLTGYGLQTISETLAPGSIAILFRNDHFSTVYKHPQSEQLFTLVTDMGYAGHDEVVWESLADVSGESCELFAGDFRPVGNVAEDTRSQPHNEHSNNSLTWTTVSRSSNKNRPRNSLPSISSNNQTLNQPVSDPTQSFSLLSIDEPSGTSMSATTEQEDHDLALALQLQEEEEDRERRESAARRHEDELSQAYLESQKPPNQRGSSQISSRGVSNNISRSQRVNPLVSSQGTTPTKQKTGHIDEDAPPPSYEQAAQGPAYLPRSDHPVHSYDVDTAVRSNSSASRPKGNRSSRQSNIYTQNSAMSGAFPPTHTSNPDVPTLAPSPVVGRGDMSRRCSSGRYADLARGGQASGISSRGGGGGDGFRRRGPVAAADDDKKECIVM